MLKCIVERFAGTRVPGAWDAFEVSVRAILGRQVSVKGATTLSGRLAQAYGTPIDGADDACNFIHPGPEKLLRARCEKIGLIKARSVALRALSKAVVQEQVSFDGAGDLERGVASLQAVQGIGPWTAHYIAMRACGEPDAFSSGDLIFRRVASGLDAALDTEAKLVEHANGWRPWRAYAAMFLWRAYVPIARQTTPRSSKNLGKNSTKSATSKQRKQK